MTVTYTSVCTVYMERKRLGEGAIRIRAIIMTSTGDAAKTLPQGERMCGDANGANSDDNCNEHIK